MNQLRSVPLLRKNTSPGGGKRNIYHWLKLWWRKWDAGHFLSSGVESSPTVRWVIITHVVSDQRETQRRWVFTWRRVATRKVNGGVVKIKHLLCPAGSRRDTASVCIKSHKFTESLYCYISPVHPGHQAIFGDTFFHCDYWAARRP